MIRNTYDMFLSSERYSLFISADENWRCCFFMILSIPSRSIEIISPSLDRNFWNVESIFSTTDIALNFSDKFSFCISKIRLNHSSASNKILAFVLSDCSIKGEKIQLNDAFKNLIIYRIPKLKSLSIPEKTWLIHRHIQKHTAERKNIWHLVTVLVKTLRTSENWSSTFCVATD